MDDVSPAYVDALVWDKAKESMTHTIQVVYRENCQGIKSPNVVITQDLQNMKQW